MDKLIPCYKEARKALDQANRRKEEVTELEEEKVRSLVVAVIQGGEPDPALSTAAAYKPLRPFLGYIANARAALVQPALVEFIKEKAKLGVSYPGQFKPLKEKYGRAAMAVFLQMALDSHATPYMRQQAIVALRDVAERGEPAVMKNLSRLEADEYQPRDLRLSAAITLARLGDDSKMEPHFTKAHKLTGRDNLKAQARGWQKLGVLWHMLGEYKAAAQNYSRWVGIIRQLVEKRERRNIDLARAIYRRACAHAMAGEVEKGLADVAEAVKFRGVSRKTLENDKELAGLHQSPRWRELLEQAPEEVRDR